jgi:hypothetical protein
VRGKYKPLEQAGHLIGVARVHGIFDGGLGLSVVLTPGRRPEGELADRLRLMAFQPCTEQLPEQVMVAVPLPVVIKGG